MKEFLIISHVAVLFRDKNGVKIFEIPAEKINEMIMAPVAIKEDPIFGLLVEDGSIEVADTKAKKQRLENTPEAGVDAEGKKTTKKETKAAE